MRAWKITMTDLEGTEILNLVALFPSFDLVEEWVEFVARTVNFSGRTVLREVKMGAAL